MNRGVRVVIPLSKVVLNNSKIIARRCFASTSVRAGNDSKDQNQESIPWYLQDPDAVQATSKHIEPIPEMPENPPKQLGPTINQMVQDLGLVDVEIFDLRHMDPPSSLGPNTIMIVASGKSDRHLIRAANGLHKFIKNEYGVVSDREGIITANFQRVHQRRLRKKAQRQFFYTNETEDGTLQTMNSWIVLDTKVEGVVAHLFTPERREQVNLQELWKNEENDEMEVPVYRAKDVKVPSGKREFHTLRRLQSSQVSSIDNMNFEMFDIKGANENSKQKEEATAKTVAYELLCKHSKDGDYLQCLQLSHHDDQDQSLVLKAHINHLINLRKTKESTKFDQNHPTFKSFFNHFPSIPNAFQYRLRLLFLSCAHILNNNKFPLQMLVDHVKYQQASGYAADDFDVEYVIRNIVYSRQEFNVEPKSGTAEWWSEIVGEKLKLITELLQFTTRAKGETFSNNESLMGILFRMCILPKSNYITIEKAVMNPAPRFPEQRGKLDWRAFRVWQMLVEKDKKSAYSNDVNALALLAFANNLEWDTFWQIWKNLALHERYDADLLVSVVAIITATGDQRAISHMLNYHLPEIMMNKKNMINRDLVRSLDLAVDHINPRKNGYEHLRKFIGTVKDNERSKNQRKTKKNLKAEKKL